MLVVVLMLLMLLMLQVVLCELGGNSIAAKAKSAAKHAAAALVVLAPGLDHHEQALSLQCCGITAIVVTDLEQVSPSCLHRAASGCPVHLLTAVVPQVQLLLSWSKKAYVSCHIAPAATMPCGIRLRVQLDEPSLAAAVTQGPPWWPTALELVLRTELLQVTGAQAEGENTIRKICPDVLCVDCAVLCDCGVLYCGVIAGTGRAGSGTCQVGSEWQGGALGSASV